MYILYNNEKSPERETLPDDQSVSKQNVFPVGSIIESEIH